MEGSGFMSYTAASHQGAIWRFWPHFWELSRSSSLNRVNGNYDVQSQCNILGSLHTLNLQLCKTAKRCYKVTQYQSWWETKYWKILYPSRPGAKHPPKFCKTHLPFFTRVFCFKTALRKPSCPRSSPLAIRPMALVTLCISLREIRGNCVFLGNSIQFIICRQFMLQQV